MTSFGSACSGIEAASIALEPLGFKPVWFSEIDPFASAVLAHHWPHVPNTGDMLHLASFIRAGVVSAPDVVVGGTPCQAYSVAGKRITTPEYLGAVNRQKNALTGRSIKRTETAWQFLA